MGPVKHCDLINRLYTTFPLDLTTTPMGFQYNNSGLQMNKDQGILYLIKENLKTTREEKREK